MSNHVIEPASANAGVCDLSAGPPPEGFGALLNWFNGPAPFTTPNGIPCPGWAPELSHAIELAIKDPIVMTIAIAAAAIRISIITWGAIIISRRMRRTRATQA